MREDLLCTKDEIGLWSEGDHISIFGTKNAGKNVFLRKNFNSKCTSKKYNYNQGNLYDGFVHLTLIGYSLKVNS